MGKKRKQRYANSPVIRRSSPEITKFGHKIGYVLAEKNLSLSELSRRAGVSRAAIYHMRITGNPGGKTIHKIAKALDVPVSYFFEKGFGGIPSNDFDS
ncbi:MAG TPA: helix-turn-helix transcriptional regulator [Desulfobacterales bacterium]|nr:helix-turn-helix transcriptional regulator [Desulfobacterales bacterium]